MAFDKESEGGIIDSENFRSNQNFGYKQIVLSQVQKVVGNLSREQREGFWVFSDNPNSASQRIKYVGDARKETIQSIETLYDLLLPKFDEQIKKEVKDFEVNLETNLQTIKDEYNQARGERTKEDLVDEHWKIRRRHYRKLFQRLCLFLERVGWLEAGDVEE